MTRYDIEKLNTLYNSVRPTLQLRLLCATTSTPHVKQRGAKTMDAPSTKHSCRTIARKPVGFANALKSPWSSTTTAKTWTLGTGYNRGI